MSSAFETIGFFVVIVIGVIAVIAFISKKSDDEKEIFRLANYSPKCRMVELENQNGGIDLLKKYRQILSDPNERTIAEKRYNEHLNQEIEKKELKKKEKIMHRNFAYNYENQILEIFDTEYELTNEEIITRLSDKLKITSCVAKDLIILLKENEVIQQDYKNSNVYKIGRILNEDAFVVSETDLSQKKWLSKNGKVLQSKVIGVYNFSQK